MHSIEQKEKQTWCFLHWPLLQSVNATGFSVKYVVDGNGSVYTGDRQYVVGWALIYSATVKETGQIGNWKQPPGKNRITLSPELITSVAAGMYQADTCFTDKKWGMFFLTQIFSRWSIPRKGYSFRRRHYMHWSKNWPQSFGCRWIGDRVFYSLAE